MGNKKNDSMSHVPNILSEFVQLFVNKWWGVQVQNRPIARTKM